MVSVSTVVVTVSMDKFDIDVAGARAVVAVFAVTSGMVNFVTIAGVTTVVMTVVTVVAVARLGHWRSYCQNHHNDGEDNGDDL